MVERIIVGPLHTNAYVFSFGKKDCIIIDPGADPEKILRELGVLNMIPRGIVLTHGHLDHTSAVAKIALHYASLGEPVPIAIHEADAEFLGPGSEERNRAQFISIDPDSDLFRELFTPLPAADILLNEGDMVFGTDLRVIHTPGHTPGSICLYSESQAIIFTGDTLFFKGIGRSDLPGGDGRLLLKNVAEKLFTLPPETRIFPGHGPNTILEREKNHNPYMTI